MNNTFDSLNPALNAILAKLCENVAVPKTLDITGNEEQRLIEEIEKQNYPLATLHCEHKEVKGIGEDCVDCQQLQYQTYKSRFLELQASKGEEHTHTLQAAFDYYYSLITQYRLTECDELLAAIYPVCLQRGKWSSYYFMAIQALSFLRFKQGRYQESIDYFNEQINVMGPNERIFENMALAYSRIGNNKEASVCYAKAILLIAQKPKAEQQYTTLLLGLSVVLDKSEDALAVLQASMDLLKIQYQKPHSLMAKTLSAMGDMHLKKDDFATAEKCYSEAVTIFIDTCGYETPLTSNAMNKHAKSLMQLGDLRRAADIFVESLKVWSKVDNDSFSVNEVAEGLVALTSINSSVQYLPDALTANLMLLQEKIIKNPPLFNDLNTICLFKFMYELYILKTDFARAIKSCQLFIEYLNQFDKELLGELFHVKDQLIQEATNILQMLKTIPNTSA